MESQELHSASFANNKSETLSNASVENGEVDQKYNENAWVEVSTLSTRWEQLKRLSRKQHILIAVTAGSVCAAVILTITLSVTLTKDNDPPVLVTTTVLPVSVTGEEIITTESQTKSSISRTTVPFPPDATKPAQTTIKTSEVTSDNKLQTTESSNEITTSEDVLSTLHETTAKPFVTTSKIVDTTTTAEEIVATTNQKSSTEKAVSITTGDPTTSIIQADGTGVSVLSETLDNM